MFLSTGFIETDLNSAMQVTYFQRRRRPNANFSLEFIFDNVRQCLNGQISARVHTAPVVSNGFFRRLWISLDAMFHQGEINHVTGDINYVAAFLSHRRTIVTILDCGFLKRGQGLRRWLLKVVWLNLPVWRSRIVTTISESAKSDIVKWSGCDPKKVVVIPVAISDKFRPSVKPTFGSPPRLLQVGTAVNKNISRLAEALREIPCILVIIGKLNDELRQKLQECHVNFENQMNLDFDALIEQFQLADIVMFASTDEGFGMPILEAQAVGRPVVTSNTSSMPEVAGDAACLVDPFDVSSIREGIRTVIENQGYREELIRRGFENVKRFDANRIADQYLDVYKGLAAVAPK